MTWFCRSCQQQNPDRSQKCKNCQSHWSEVWEPKVRKTRSKSRKDKAAKSDKKEDKQASMKQEGSLELIGKVPWIPSTPSTRHVTRNSDAQQEPELPAVPPQPVLPPAPSRSEMTDEEGKLLAHLRGLIDMKVELPAELMAQYEMLSQKEKHQNSNKELSHSHINRLDRAKEKAEKAAKKIKEVDQGWHDFVAAIQTKVKEHGKMYQDCRAELMLTYNARLAEVQKIMEEVSQASQNLLGAKSEQIDFLAEAPDIAAAFQGIQDLVEEAGQVISISDEEHAMEAQEETEEDQELVKDGERKGTAKAKTFSGAPSPNRVANLHLKAKPKETKP